MSLITLKCNELDKRGIDLHSTLCPLCELEVETVNHCLGTCNNAKELWDKIIDWWALQTGDEPTTVGDIFRHQGRSSYSEFILSLWQASVWVTGYYLWNNRNSKVFGVRLKVP